MKAIQGYRRLSRTRGFTFIELIVAVALTAVLLRGMYTIFFSAADLARLSDEKIAAVQEGAAVCDSLAFDISRSPYLTSNYYLCVSADQKSITFQAMSKDTTNASLVYVEYSISDASGNYHATNHNGTLLLRTVWKDSNRTQLATQSESGEDGSSTVVARNVAAFKAWYFDNNKTDINSDSSWLFGTINGATRTRALKVAVTIHDPSALLPDQIFTPVIPVFYCD